MSKLERSSHGIDQDWIRKNESNEGVFYETNNGMVNKSEEIKKLGEEIQRLWEQEELSELVSKINNLTNKISRKYSPLKVALLSETFKEYISNEEYTSYLTSFNEITKKYNEISKMENSKEKLNQLNDLNTKLTKLSMEVRNKLSEVYEKIQEEIQRVENNKEQALDKIESDLAPKTTPVNNEPIVNEPSVSEVEVEETIEKQPLEQAVEIPKEDQLIDELVEANELNAKLSSPQQASKAFIDLVQTGKTDGYVGEAKNIIERISRDELIVLMLKRAIKNFMIARTQEVKESERNLAYALISFDFDKIHEPFNINGAIAQINSDPKMVEAFYSCLDDSEYEKQVDGKTLFDSEMEKGLMLGNPIHRKADVVIKNLENNNLELNLPVRENSVYSVDSIQTPTTQTITVEAQKEALIDKILKCMGDEGEFSYIPLEDMGQRIEAMKEIKTKLDTKSIEYLEYILSTYSNPTEDLGSTGKSK